MITPAPDIQRLRSNGVRSRRWVPALAWPLAASLTVLASSCSSGGGSVAAQAPSSPVTVSVVATLPASSEPATATTVEPTTLAPTTTEAPSATDAPTTTEAPTTTAAPTTTMPPNVEPIAPSAVPIEPVGTSDGDATRVLQERLLQLGFWHAGVDGEYGTTTKQAVMAFQKYLGLAATGSVDETTAAYLTNLVEKAHGTADTGDLIEVDKSRQLLFIIRGGKTIWAINASTGSEVPYEEKNKNDPTKIEQGDSVTPTGLYKVYREHEDGWREGDLGEIYRPKYFRGGIAVHGSGSIPNYPASHGCVRVTTTAMDMIWEYDVMPRRSVVWVHGSIPGAPL